MVVEECISYKVRSHRVVGIMPRVRWVRPVPDILDRLWSTLGFVLEQAVLSYAVTGVPSSSLIGMEDAELHHIGNACFARDGQSSVSKVIQHGVEKFLMESLVTRLADGYSGENDIVSQLAMADWVRHGARTFVSEMIFLVIVALCGSDSTDSRVLHWIQGATESLSRASRMFEENGDHNQFLRCLEGARTCGGEAKSFIMSLSEGQVMSLCGRRLRENGPIEFSMLGAAVTLITRLVETELVQFRVSRRKYILAVTGSILECDVLGYNYDVPADLPKLPDDMCSEMRFERGVVCSGSGAYQRYAPAKGDVSAPIAIDGVAVCPEPYWTTDGGGIVLLGITYMTATDKRFRKNVADILYPTDIVKSRVQLRVLGDGDSPQRDVAVTALHEGGGLSLSSLLLTCARVCHLMNSTRSKGSEFISEGYLRPLVEDRIMRDCALVGPYCCSRSLFRGAIPLVADIPLTLRLDHSVPSTHVECMMGLGHGLIIPRLPLSATEMVAMHRSRRISERRMLVVVLGGRATNLTDRKFMEVRRAVASLNYDGNYNMALDPFDVRDNGKTLTMGSLTFFKSNSAGFVFNSTIRGSSKAGVLNPLVMAKREDAQSNLLTINHLAVNTESTELREDALQLLAEIGVPLECITAKAGVKAEKRKEVEEVARSSMAFSVQKADRNIVRLNRFRKQIITPGHSTNEVLEEIKGYLQSYDVYHRVGWSQHEIARLSDNLLWKIVRFMVVSWDIRAFGKFSCWGSRSRPPPGHPDHGRTPPRVQMATVISREWGRSTSYPAVVMTDVSEIPGLMAEGGTTTLTSSSAAADEVTRTGNTALSSDSRSDSDDSGGFVIDPNARTTPKVIPTTLEFDRPGRPPDGNRYRGKGVSVRVWMSGRAAINGHSGRVYAEQAGDGETVVFFSERTRGGLKHIVNIGRILVTVQKVQTILIKLEGLARAPIRLSRLRGYSPADVFGVDPISGGSPVTPGISSPHSATLAYAACDGDGLRPPEEGRKAPGSSATSIVTRGSNPPGQCSTGVRGSGGGCEDKELYGFRMKKWLAESSVYTTGALGDGSTLYNNSLPRELCYTIISRRYSKRQTERWVMGKAPFPGSFLKARIIRNRMEVWYVHAGGDINVKSRSVVSTRLLHTTDPLGCAGRRAPLSVVGGLASRAIIRLGHDRTVVRGFGCRGSRDTTVGEGGHGMTESRTLVTTPCHNCPVGAANGTSSRKVAGVTNPALLDEMIPHLPQGWMHLPGETTFFLQGVGGATVLSLIRLIENSSREAAAWGDPSND